MKTGNVLFVANSGRLYGAERSLLDLVANLPPHIHPYVLTPGAGALTAALKAKNVPVFVVPHLGWIATRLAPARRIAAACFNYGARRSIQRICKEHAIRLVYTNSLWSRLGADAAAALSLPHIWHIREFVGRSCPANFVVGETLGHRTIQKSTVHLIFNSRNVAQHYVENLSTIPANVVYNGIIEPDTCPPLRLGAPDCSMRLAVVASVRRHKNQAEAIRAVGLLRGKGIPAELVLTGDGDKGYLAELKALSKELAIAEHVKFTGFVDDISSLLQSAAGLIVCSYREPFGRVIVEAMAHSCPVIATYAGGVPELIKNKVTGLTYEPGSSQALADAVRQLFGDEALRKTMVRNAYVFAIENFTIDKYVAAITAIIDRYL
jgi:glycosyltransferase involved in cell wall biosynthesis